MARISPPDLISNFSLPYWLSFSHRSSWQLLDLPQSWPWAPLSESSFLLQFLLISSSLSLHSPSYPQWVSPLTALLETANQNPQLHLHHLPSPSPVLPISLCPWIFATSNCYRIWHNPRFDSWAWSLQTSDSHFLMTHYLLYLLLHSELVILLLNNYLLVSLFWQLFFLFYFLSYTQTQA